MTTSALSGSPCQAAYAIPEVLARGPVLYKEDHVPEGANAIVHVNLRDPFNRGIAMPYG